MVKKEKKKIVTYEVERFSPYDFETTLISIQEMISRLVREHGPEARMNYDSRGSDPYSDSPEFNLMVDREETDEEFEKRVAEQTVQQAEQEARDRAELKRLQDKLGVK